MNVVEARYWHEIEDGRIQCDLCPRFCRLHDEQRGLCFVRKRQNDRMVLTSYGKSSGFVIDPIEKKPLNHFYPGSSVLSFGTAGCNLSCDFCQNWDISKSREMDTLASQASPKALAEACVAHERRGACLVSRDSRVGRQGAFRTFALGRNRDEPELAERRLVSPRIELELVVHVVACGSRQQHGAVGV